jgi:hypothetical protein
MRSTIFLLPLLSTFALGKSDAILLEKNPPNILDGWSFEAGVAFITKNNIGEIFSGEITRDTGDAGGELYQLTATKHLASLQWEIFGETFTPQLELPLCLEIVDENSRDPFLDYNASLQLRWIDFPWNDTITTSFGIGLGLSYSSKIYLMDQQRHPGEDRSHLKFNLPIHLSFALPAYPDQELIFYLAHQSGGFHIFDKGGVNSLGIGLRHRF